MNPPDAPPDVEAALEPDDLEEPSHTPTLTPPPFPDTTRRNTGSVAYSLPPEGAQFGGRFLLERRLRAGPSGGVYRAKDEKTRRTVLIRVIPPDLIEEIGHDELERQVARSKGLKGRGIARLYGMKSDGAARYLVYEWVQGQPLSELATAKRNAGKQFTAMGAYNIVGNVLWALQTAHGSGVHHGDLRPENVFIDKKGRVKVADFCVAALFTAGRLRLRERKGAYEVAESTTGPKSDLRNATLMFAELFTGRPARHAVEALPEALHAVVAPWQSANPAARPETDAATLRASLQQAVKAARTGAAAPQTQAAPGKKATPSPSRTPPPMPMGDDERIETFSPVPIPTGPPAPPPEATGRQPSAKRLPPPGKSAALFKEVLAKMGAPTARSDEQWLAQQDGLDYGPFSAAELMDRVRAGEFDEETQLQELSSGRTAKLRDFPSFDQHLSRFFAEKKARAAVEKAQHQARVKTAKKAGKGVFATGLIGGTAVVGIIGWIFLHTPHPKPVDYSEVTLALGGVLKEPTLEPVESLARARYKAHKKRKRKARKRAMLEVVDSYGGEAGDGDGVSRVDMTDEPDGAAGPAKGWNQNKVDRVLAKAQNKLGACIRKELKRNPGVGRIELVFKVTPKGGTKAVRVTGKSTKLLGKCMVGVIKAQSFPKFDGFDRKVTLPFDVAR